MSRLTLGTTDLHLLGQLFERLPDSPFFVKDRELRYLAANRAMARVCGVRDPDALIGRTAGDFFPPSHAERYEALDRNILAGAKAITDQLELSVTRRGGSTWLLFSRFPVHDAAGEVVGIAGTSRRLVSPDRHDPTYRRLVGVLDHIRRHFDEPLNLARLSARAGISKSQLERDFAGLFGMTLQAFLHRTRMEHAMRRLEGMASIAVIAQECGYSDHSAFTRRFRTLVGLSPRQFRSRLAAERAL